MYTQVSCLSCGPLLFLFFPSLVCAEERLALEAAGSCRVFRRLKCVLWLWLWEGAGVWLSLSCLHLELICSQGLLSVDFLFYSWIGPLNFGVLIFF